MYHRKPHPHAVRQQQIRVKPEPEVVVKQCRAQLSDYGTLGLYTISRESMNLKLIFVHGKLIKAEVIE